MILLKMLALMELATNQTFRQKAAIAETTLLKIVGQLDQFALPKQDKVKLFKAFAIPKMRWVLMVQDLLPTALAKINCKIEGFIKKWWALPRSASRDAIRLALGMPSIIDMAEQGQLLKHHIAQSSKDHNAQAAWKNRKARNYKPIRKMAAIFGAELPASRMVAKHKLAAKQSAKLRDTVAKLKIQGQWSKLDMPVDWQRKWRSLIWGLPTSVTQFATKAALDILPTKANLLRWHVAMDSGCARCCVKETLHHVLNNCSHLLKSGAYTWRHNNVLQQLHSDIVKTNIWPTIYVDLPGHTYRLPFAPDASWRPDLVLLDCKHHIVFVELTVPYEANISSAHARKTFKYETLLENARDAGFLPTLECIEMGSRGVPSKAWSAWTKRQKLKAATTKVCAQIALRASMAIWQTRHSHWPSPDLLGPVADEW